MKATRSGQNIHTTYQHSFYPFENKNHNLFICVVRFEDRRGHAFVIVTYFSYFDNYLTTTQIIFYLGCGLINLHFHYILLFNKY